MCGLLSIKQDLLDGWMDGFSSYANPFLLIHPGSLLVSLVISQKQHMCSAPWLQVVPFTPSDFLTDDCQYFTTLRDSVRWSRCNSPSLLSIWKWSAWPVASSVGKVGAIYFVDVSTVYLSVLWKHCKLYVNIYFKERRIIKYFVSDAFICKE